MGARIAIMGTGAVGGYAGAHMAQAGEDVTFIDPWPENVETMKSKGLKISHIRDVPEFTVPVRALHLTELQSLSKEAPIDIAFVCMKSYDTAWATTMIKQYLAPDGYIVSLQNCINEETIAKVTTNLWGERWSKLVTNAMANGMSASTGLISRDILMDDGLRRFGARLGSEAIRVGQALGYQLEEIHHIDPEVIARAGEGDAKAIAEYDEHRLKEAKKPGGGAHRPSMGQDMVKGRRTEIEFLNGFIVGKAEAIGIPTPANAALTDIVKRVEKGELEADPKHILDLRLN